jgi:amino acid permease
LPLLDAKFDVFFAWAVVGGIQIKSIGTKLVPFFITVVVYFVIFIPDNQQSWYTTVLVCLPIVSLMFFVLWHMESIDHR